ncbi:alpha/beta hydrolase [Bifidobacterium saguini DSM 23967]|uniref:Alpha/beta hydrolase n=3 Tax=Bifidobacterium TaxID=1678 RepID=A0A2N5IRI9_9BIFI|nr:MULTISPECIES: alpha/beta hydrolase [Bifidobacterium]KFI92031.1 alpha/beta hydrolase [Bifidobacterium saguini DSM 23967]PLS24566.1 alpha/beta hydrolase [Bifidobacterium imperatoris]QSY58055.1 alpha/beta hydrolase [Bifidobacterium imperatoris]QTB90264.1 alpha/beta hydrolase [Bifidobacterium saguini]
MAIELVNHVYREGEGVPVVLMNAYPVDHRMWDVCAKALVDFSDLDDVPPFPIWAPDMAGSGASPVPSAEDSGPQLPNGSYPEALDRLADAYVNLIKAAGYSQAIWVGLSMGGYVAMDIQRRHPETVAGLALCDTMAASDGVGGEGRLAMADAAEQTNSVEPVMHFAKPSEGDSTVKKTPEFVETMTRWIEEQNPAGLAWRQRMTYGRPDMSAVPETISAPTLVISGELDPTSNPSVMRPLSARIRGAEFIDIPDCGHFSAVEHPDVVARALLSLVRRVQAA